MNYEKLLTTLNSEYDLRAREEIVLFLQHCKRELQRNPESATEIAYAIAGLMATDYAKSLTENDPIDAVLTIAGELETHPLDAAMLCDELLAAIDRL